MTDLTILPNPLLKCKYALDISGNLYKWCNPHAGRKITGHWKLRGLDYRTRKYAQSVKVAMIVDGVLYRQSLGSAMLETFGVPKSSEEHMARHLDFDSLNNELTNLKWMTSPEYMQYRKEYKTH